MNWSIIKKKIIIGYNSTCNFYPHLHSKHLFFWFVKTVCLDWVVGVINKTFFWHTVSMTSRKTYKKLNDFTRSIFWLFKLKLHGYLSHLHYLSSIIWVFDPFKDSSLTVNHFHFDNSNKFLWMKIDNSTRVLQFNIDVVIRAFKISEVSVSVFIVSVFR